jgi:hemerythrin-like metal-binding protein
MKAPLRITHDTYKKIVEKGDGWTLNAIKWNDRFNIGVEVVDKAHQKLFSIVGKLIVLNEEEKKQQHACREGIKYFKNYTLKHFAEEEAYMQSIGYPGYELHKKLHDNMCHNTLPALEEEMEEQDYSRESVGHFIGICIGWLNEHIMIEDHAIVGGYSHRWVHQSSEDAILSLQKAIVQAAKNLFRVDARLVSDHYSGEDFCEGNKLCLRLTYGRPEKKAQVYFIYEERLILASLSEMLGRQIPYADKTVIYTVKVLSQNFIEQMAVHFTDGEPAWEKTDVMTFDQVLNTFYKEYPPYSMLFGTGGKGYFAICIRN